MSRVENQMVAFMEGFNQIVPQNQLTIFDANELEVSLVLEKNMEDMTPDISWVL